MNVEFLRDLNTCEHYELWISDKAPTKLEDVIGNPGVTSSILKYIENNNLPNILLSGPNGSGKRTIANLAIKKYLGEYLKEGSLYINGNINRGKDSITDTGDSKKSKSESNIMTFSKRLLKIGGKCRIVIIYNFDSMTQDSQNSLRRVMEIFSHKTRFILICNNISDIIEPLQSRCVPLHCTYLNDKEIEEALLRINPDLKKDLKDTICLTSNGDLKKAINYLQIISSASKMDIKTFYEIFNLPSVYNINKIIKACLSKNSQQKAYDVLNMLVDNGYNVRDILDIFVMTLVRYKDITLKKKVMFLQAMSDCFYKAEASSQLFALVGILCEINAKGYYVHNNLSKLK